MADPVRLQEDLRRSLHEAPDCLRCRTMLGFLLTDLGRTAEAEAMLLPAASDGLPETQLYALLGLARAAESRGDRAAAVSRWSQIAALAPDPSWSRRQLARVLLEGGRVDEAWAAIRRNLGRGEALEDLTIAIQIARAKGDAAEVRELSKRLAPTKWIGR
jgi:Tfp pilus assembly protein PilF